MEEWVLIDVGQIKKIKFSAFGHKPMSFKC